MPVAPHILVIRRRYLGDIALLGSFLRNLRLHLARSQIGAPRKRPTRPPRAQPRHHRLHRPARETHRVA